MEQLLSLLKTIPEYKTMISALQKGESVAVTGIGQMNRSHIIAGLCREVVLKQQQAVAIGQFINILGLAGVQQVQIFHNK